jgi:hypothetical protein
MERLTLVIIGLFIVLFIGQVYVREYFVTSDISNSTITMTLSELLYTIGVGTQERQQKQRQQGESCDGHEDDNELQQYLTMKQEMLNGVKSGLHKLPSKVTPSRVPPRVTPSRVTPSSKCDEEPILAYVSPSCIQGSAYMETVPLVSSSSCNSC